MPANCPPVMNILPQPPSIRRRRRSGSSSPKNRPQAPPPSGGQEGIQCRGSLEAALTMPSPACQAHSPPCSLLLATILALSGASAQSGGQERHVLQPEGPMLVAEGDTLLLRCTVLGSCSGDTMKWVQVRGPQQQQQQQEIYSFRRGVFPGVTPLVPQTQGSSDCNFSILIHVTKAHAGTYHCTGLGGSGEDGRLDEGTDVLVWGARDPEPGIWLTQPQELVLANAMDDVLLNCTVLGVGPPGPIRWFRGAGLSREAIYNFGGISQPHAKAVRASVRDFSILLEGVSTESSGTYYCAKFHRRPNKQYLSGQGTRLKVRAKPPTLEEAELIGYHISRPSESGLLPTLITVLVLKAASVVAFLLALAVYRKGPRREGPRAWAQQS